MYFNFALQYLKIPKKKGRISKAHRIRGSHPSFQPANRFFENWKDVHVFGTLPVISRPDRWGAQIPLFSKGKKATKIRSQNCFVLSYIPTLLPNREMASPNTSIKTSSSHDSSCNSAPNNVDLETTWTQRLNFPCLLLKTTTEPTQRPGLCSDVELYLSDQSTWVSHVHGIGWKPLLSMT